MWLLVASTYLDERNTVACLLQRLDPAVIPAVQKAQLRDDLSKLQQTVLQQQKKAAAERKARASNLAVAECDKAAQLLQPFAVIHMEDGIDHKAMQEAWNAIQKKHPDMAVAMFAADKGT